MHLTNFGNSVNASGNSVHAPVNIVYPLLTSINAPKALGFYADPNIDALQLVIGNFVM